MLCRVRAGGAFQVLWAVERAAQVAVGFCEDLLQQSRGKKGTCRCSGRGAVARGGLSELGWMTL